MSVVASEHTFSVEALAGLGGPDWLAARRRRAHAAFAATPLPQPSDDDWRYGRLGELSLGRYGPPAQPSDVAARAGALEPLAGEAELASLVRRFVDDLGARAALVVDLDGLVVGREIGAAADAAGVRVASLRGEAAAPVGLGARFSDAPDAFVLLADSCLADGVLVEVPAGARLAEPIVLVHALGAASADRAVFPRTVIEVGEGAEVTIVELLVSGPLEALVVPVSEIAVAPGAHATHCSAQELGAGVWHLGYQASAVGRAGVLRSFSAALGGEYARHWNRTVLAGEGGESQLHAVYLGQGTQVEEFRTFQEHVAPRTRSDLVFKGAVGDAARSVYTGLVRMHRGARRADAAQTNRNLVLSEAAEAYSVPNLDIQENDVRCSHASAVGPIDAEQRFYLESRGVPTPVAERLILLGFFEDLLGRAPHAGFAAHLRAIVTERLAPGGHEAALLAAARRAAQ